VRWVFDVVVNGMSTPTLTLRMCTNERTGTELRSASSSFSASTTLQHRSPTATTRSNSKTDSTNMHTHHLAKHDSQQTVNSTATMQRLGSIRGRLKIRAMSGGSVCMPPTVHTPPGGRQAGHPPIVWTCTTNAACDPQPRKAAIAKRMSCSLGM
jgi:hypothetical protein